MYNLFSIWCVSETLVNIIAPLAYLDYRTSCREHGFICLIGLMWKVRYACYVRGATICTLSRSWFLDFLLWKSFSLSDFEEKSRDVPFSPDLVWWHIPSLRSFYNDFPCIFNCLIYLHTEDLSHSKRRHALMCSSWKTWLAEVWKWQTIIA